jgi:hypothetical protein
MHQRGEPAEHPILLTDFANNRPGWVWTRLESLASYTRGQQVKLTFVDDVGRS